MIASVVAAVRPCRCVACTGAIAYNVFRPDTVVVDLQDRTTLESHTDRPSVSDDVPTKYEGSEIDDLQVNGDWEPRQAVSLGLKDEALSVDMVTVTIGGNDMRFSSVTDMCVRSVCDAASIPSVFDGLKRSKSVETLLSDLEGTLVEVFEELTRITRTTSTPDREASVFVLGYPYLVPPESANLGRCDLLTARRVAPQPLYDALVGLENPDPGTVTPPTDGFAANSAVRLSIRGTSATGTALALAAMTTPTTTSTATNYSWSRGKLLRRAPRWRPATKRTRCPARRLQSTCWATTSIPTRTSTPPRSLFRGRPVPAPRKP